MRVILCSSRKTHRTKSGREELKNHRPRGRRILLFSLYKLSACLNSITIESVIMAIFFKQSSKVNHPFFKLRMYYEAANESARWRSNDEGSRLNRLAIRNHKTSSFVFSRLILSRHDLVYTSTPCYSYNIHFLRSTPCYWARYHVGFPSFPYVGWSGY